MTQYWQYYKFRSFRCSRILSFVSVLSCFCATTIETEVYIFVYLVVKLMISSYFGKSERLNTKKGMWMIRTFRRVRSVLALVKLTINVEFLKKTARSNSDDQFDNKICSEKLVTYFLCFSIEMWNSIATPDKSKVQKSRNTIATCFFPSGSFENKVSFVCFIISYFSCDSCWVLILPFTCSSSWSIPYLHCISSVSEIICISFVLLFSTCTLNGKRVRVGNKMILNK